MVAASKTQLTLCRTFKTQHSAKVYICCQSDGGCIHNTQCQCGSHPQDNHQHSWGDICIKTKINPRCQEVTFLSFGCVNLNLLLFWKSQSPEKVSIISSGGFRNASLYPRLCCQTSLTGFSWNLLESGKLFLCSSDFWAKKYPTLWLIGSCPALFIEQAAPPLLWIIVGDVWQAFLYILKQYEGARLSVQRYLSHGPFLWRTDVCHRPLFNTDVLGWTLANTFLSELHSVFSVADYIHVLYTMTRPVNCLKDMLWIMTVSTFGGFSNIYAAC